MSLVNGLATLWPLEDTDQSPPRPWFSVRDGDQWSKDVVELSAIAPEAHIYR